MKTPSSYLYDLVHTLTKSEKRYIKVQAGSDDKDYIQLMNALLAQKTFNEEELIKNNKEAKFVKHLSSTKKYLYNFILKSLMNFGEKEPEDKVLEKIAAAKILFNKKLKEQALKELQQAEKIAKKYEFLDLLFQIISLKKNFMEIHNTKILEKLYKENVECLAKKQNLNEYWHLDHQLGLFHYHFYSIKTQEHRQIVLKIMEAPELQNIALAMTYESKLFFYKIHGRYQVILNNFEQARKLYEQTLHLSEANTYFLLRDIPGYLASVWELLMIYEYLDKIDAFEGTLQRIKAIPEQREFNLNKNTKKYAYVKALFFDFYFRSMVFYLLRQDSKTKYKRILSLIPEIEEGLKEYGNILIEIHQNVLRFYIAVAYFQNKLYAQALDWNIKMLHDFNDNNTMARLIYDSKTLNLLIHYELGNFTLLESLLPSTSKYLKSKRPLFATEKALFRFLNKSMKAENENERKDLIHKFNIELNELPLKDSERKFFTTAELLCWIENRG